MSANQLTDTQLVLLSAAAQHPEGAIELASDLKGSTVKKTVGRLLRGGSRLPAAGSAKTRPCGGRQSGPPEIRSRPV